MNIGVSPDFWKGRKVFLTGHTGFKGGWLSLWLQDMGADVTGYALAPSGQPNLFSLACIEKGMTSVIGDICNAPALQKALQVSQAEIVFHLAAQPLVRLSYEQPGETAATNIMGTVHLLEAVRTLKPVRAVVVVTSDKCYENREIKWGYRETDPMGGHDPYSASKGYAELLSAAWRNSFFRHNGVGLATARAGNVIGGGDWSRDRLVPDILNAIEKQIPLTVRNPHATRPWQHVLEPLAGYLMLAQNLYEKGDRFTSGWNFGPHMEDVCSVEWIVRRLSHHSGKPVDMQVVMPDRQQHEAGMLALDHTKAWYELGWKPIWSLDEALIKTAEWARACQEQDNMRTVCLRQIHAYHSGSGNRETAEDVE
ncbi:MAG: CDP-glucose 4,6-dehydratase [Pseudomonadota bacterium]|nr:CDP-glucose 4,6-dehydratase [Pseudomonadota bacterium]